MDNVFSKHPAYVRMCEQWDLLHDLLGGTRAMRAARSKWLPQETKEKDNDYFLRLNRSILYEAYKDTIEKLADKPFSRPIEVNNAPPVLEILETDVDRTGKHLSSLGRAMFSDLVTYGMAHVLVDHSVVPEGATLAEEREAGARTVFVRVPPPALFAWKSEITTSGVEVLTEIRMTETRIVGDGRWKQKEEIVIRVITPEGFQLHKKVDEDWLIIEEGEHTFGRIFLVTVYAHPVGFLEADPPLEGLGWLNLAHWQSMSDQRNILRFARIGTYFLSGITEDEQEKGIIVGPTNFVSSQNPDARMSVVEHSGSSIEAGSKDLRDLESKMEILGLQPEIRSSANVTATGKRIDESRNISAMQSWIRNLEKGLREAYSIAAEWEKIELPEDFTLDIYSDFAVTGLSDGDSKFLLDSCTAGKLSIETYLNEIRRRGKISDNVETQEELDRIHEEQDGMLLDEGIE